MRTRRARAILALLLAAGVAVGCGSSKKKVEVVTVTAPAATPHTTSTPASTPTSSPTSSPSKTTTAPQSTGTSGSAATPTAPASAQGSGGADAGSAAAQAEVKAKGYTPSVTYSYRPSNTLGVILGTRGSGDQRAFFFVRGRFIGTDTSDPSAGVTLVAQDDTSATLSYALYKPGDKLCCPTDHASVTYALDNGKLEPQGPIPSSSGSAPLSRR